MLAGKAGIAQQRSVNDAIRSCSLIIRAIAAGIEAGKQGVATDEMAAPRNGDAAAPPAVEEAPPAAPTAETAPAETIAGRSSYGSISVTKRAVLPVLRTLSILRR